MIPFSSRLKEIKPASSHNHSARNEDVFYSLSLGRRVGRPLSKADPLLILFYGVYRLVFKDSRHLRRTEHVVRIGEVVVVVIVVFARVSFTRVMCREFSVVYSIVSVSLYGMLLRCTRSVPRVMVMLLRRGEWNVVHLVSLLLLNVVIVRRKVDAAVRVVLSECSVNVHRTRRQRIFLTPERLSGVLVGQDQVIVVVGVRFGGSTGGSGDGALYWTGSLIEVPRLRGQVVHAAPVRRPCLLSVAMVDVFGREMRGSGSLHQVEAGG